MIQCPNLLNKKGSDKFILNFAIGSKRNFFHWLSPHMTQLLKIIEISWIEIWGSWLYQHGKTVLVDKSYANKISAVKMVLLRRMYIWDNSGEHVFIFLTKLLILKLYLHIFLACIGLIYGVYWSWYGKLKISNWFSETINYIFKLD